MPSSAAILAFPVNQVRKGLKTSLLDIRAMIISARDTADWTLSQSKITPDFVLDLLPAADAMDQAGEARLADIAIKVSILCMHAIQTGDWKDTGALTQIANLQTIAAAYHAHARHPSSQKGNLAHVREAS